MDKIYKYLQDIKLTVCEVLEETATNQFTFNDLTTNRLYLRFVERNITVIGEAMNQLLKLKPDINISSARKIVNTRNLVVHSYDSLDKEIIWGIIVRHLPTLLREVDNILSQELTPKPDSQKEDSK